MVWKNIMEVWKDYTIEDAIFNRKNHEGHQAEKNEFLLEITMSRCCKWPDRIYDRANQRNHEEDCGYGKRKKKGGDESFQSMDLEKIQELIDITSEELTDLMVMSSSKPVLDDEWEDTARNQTDIKLPGRRPPITPDFF